MLDKFEQLNVLGDLVLGVMARHMGIRPQQQSSWYALGYEIGDKVDSETAHKIYEAIKQQRKYLLDIQYTPF